MKIVCDRKQLLAALGQVGGVVPARSPNPILTNVRLTAAPFDQAELEATDTEVGIHARSSPAAASAGISPIWAQCSPPASRSMRASNCPCSFSRRM